MSRTAQDPNHHYTGQKYSSHAANLLQETKAARYIINNRKRHKADLGCSQFAQLINWSCKNILSVCVSL